MSDAGEARIDERRVHARGDAPAFHGDDEELVDLVGDAVGAEEDAPGLGAESERRHHVLVLVERAADVTLKERRRLLLVPRETPLSLIHLRNLVTVTEAGATVIPAAPGFYHRPKAIAELVDFVVQRVLDHLELDLSIAKRWEGE